MGGPLWIERNVLMAKCAATNKDGSPCQAQALKAGSHCFTHSPETGAARADAHRLGGQRRRVGHNADVASVPPQVRTSTDVLIVLDYGLKEALALENSIARGRLLVAICSVYVQTIKIGEFENRIAKLEARGATKEEDE